jgi:IS5 family transposase
MLDAAIKNSGEMPEHLLADAGYKSEDTLAELEDREVDAYVSTGREGKSAKKIDPNKPATKNMQRKLRTRRGRKRYAQRKGIVEAPFGWIKRCLGFRSFSLRGLDQVSGEWALVCLALNLKRMNQRMAW